MNPELPNPPDTGIPDEPEPLPPARGHGIVAERLFSFNGLVSALLLSWSVYAFTHPDRARRFWFGLWERFPRLFGASSPGRPSR
jgi:hypothetical protein